MKTSRLPLHAIGWLLLFVSQHPAFSQPHSPPPFIKPGSTNVMEIRRDFENWKKENKSAPEKKAPRKLNSFKHSEEENKEVLQTERWLYWAERHLNSEGKLAPSDQNYISLKSYRDSHKGTSGRSSSVANWVSLGPDGIAPPKDTTQPYKVDQGSGRINCITFHPTDSLIMWVGSPTGGLFKTIDGGNSWFPIGENVLTNRISDIAVQASNPDVMYVCTGDVESAGFLPPHAERPLYYGVGILKSTDGGITWSPTGMFQPAFDPNQSPYNAFRRILINPNNPNELVAAGFSGLYKSLDGGNTWTRTWQGNEIFCDLSQNAVNYKTLYAVNYNGFGIFSGIGDAGVWKSTDFGTSWTMLLTPVIPTLDYVCRLAVSVSPADTGKVYVLASNSFHLGFHALYRSDDAGATWSIKSSLDTGAPDILGYYPWPDLGFFGGQGFYNIALKCDPIDPLKIYIGGINIFMSDDGGETFNFVTFNADANKPALHVDQHMFAFNPHTGNAYACHDGGISRIREIIPAADSILYSSDCVDIFAGTLLPCFQLPTEHEYLPNGLVNTEFYRLGVDPHTPGQVAGGTQDNNGFIRDQQQNGDWFTIGSGDGFECMFHPGIPNALFYSSYNGLLDYSTDLGVTMNPATDSLLNAGGVGAWITPYQIMDDAPHTLYAGINDVWKSHDYVNWEKISDFPNFLFHYAALPIYSMKVAPSDTNVIFAFMPAYPYFETVDSAALVRTTDGGASWSNITYNLPLLASGNFIVTMMEIKPDDPNTIWLALSGYTEGEKVYKSTDGGNTWTNISGTLPNVPVYCVIYHKNSPTGGLYIGTEVGVFYRDNNSTDWVPFQTGMPNTIVMDLDIQYTEQKLYAATYGRGIWVSDTEEISTGVNLASRTEAFYFALSPNPSNGEVALNAGNMADGKALIQVYDALGGVRMIQQVQISGNKLSVKLDLAQLANGVYYIQLRDATGNSVVRKLIRN